jgi:hypothetical protein
MPSPDQRAKSPLHFRIFLLEIHLRASGGNFPAEEDENRAMLSREICSFGNEARAAKSGGSEPLVFPQRCGLAPAAI